MEAAGVYLGGSTVPVVVVIVVKYKAYLLVSRLVNYRRIGTIIRLVDYMRIGIIGCLGCRRNGTVVIRFIPQAYQYGVLSTRVAGHISYNSYWV